MEEWRDIPGYEGLYQVSNKGRIRSCERKVKSQMPWVGKETERTVSSQIIKPCVAANGYLYVSLWKEGRKTNTTVHRLVATAFVENKENKPCVNHKDYNRQNPSADNLEWVTYRENVIYSRIALSNAHIGKASTQGKSGEMYISRTPCGHYKLVISRLGINKTYATIEEAVAARGVIVGW